MIILSNLPAAGRDVAAVKNPSTPAGMPKKVPLYGIPYSGTSAFPPKRRRTSAQDEQWRRHRVEV